MSSRKIIHVDADCFYAAVEERDDPSLRGKPVAVGGRPDGRGVIATASYTARSFGVRSAMSSAQALRLCPDLLFIKPDMAKYREASRGMRAVFEQYTALIEPLSLDEAYLDVSDVSLHQGSATRMAAAIKQAVFESVGIRVSAGVSVNKFLAKVASDWEKPDGLTVLGPDQIDGFVARLPIRKFPGVGPRTAERLMAAGFTTGADLRHLDRRQWIKEWGALGERLYHLSRGDDRRSVKSERISKSVSVETTFEVDLPDLLTCREALWPLIERLMERVGEDKRARVRSQFVKLKFSDFSQTTAEGPAGPAMESGFDRHLQDAFARADQGVRLIGVGVRLGSPEIAKQLTLPWSDTP